MVLQGYFTLFPAVANDVVRVICFIDHEPLNANPAVADLLDTSVGSSPYITNTYNHDKVLPHARFRILSDKLIPLCNYAATVVSQLVPFTDQHNVEGTTVWYSADAGTISDVLKNNIGFYLVSQSGNTAFTGQVSYYFTDV